MLFSLLSSALAATNEVDLEVGWLGSSDASFNRVSDTDLLPSYGLRVGLKVHERVAVVAGWQHSQTGARISSGDDSYYYDGGGNSSFTAAYFGEMLSVGAKADVRVNDYFYPYLTAQGALVVGTVRLDDDSGADDNLGQRKQGGTTGGGLLAIGAEVPVALGSSGIALAPYLEVGYGLLAPMALEDLGALKLGGFTGRAGFGVRF